MQKNLSFPSEASEIKPLQYNASFQACLLKLGCGFVNLYRMALTCDNRIAGLMIVVMAAKFQLREQPIVAFVATSDPDRAKKFYRDTLGLRLVSEQLPFALVFDLHGTMLRVSIVNKFKPAGFTVLGWHVPKIQVAVTALTKAGVEFERYPGMDQDELGIWSSPSGARIAWFKDPDGNTLSLSEGPEN